VNVILTNGGAQPAVVQQQPTAGPGSLRSLAGKAPVPRAVVFQNSYIGGLTSVTFTAHIDTSFAYNPLGAQLHLFRDLT
jgi:hypothetical protein